MHFRHQVGSQKLSVPWRAVQLLGILLLGGCSPRQETRKAKALDEFARKLGEYRERLQEVISVDSETDALGKGAWNFSDFLDQVKNDPGPWSANLMMESEPIVSGDEVKFSFSYCEGMKIKVRSQEEGLYFDSGLPSVATLAVARRGDNFELVDLAVPDEISNLESLEKWLLTLSSVAPEELAKFKFLIPSGATSVVVESPAEPGDGLPGSAAAQYEPWSMQVPAQKISVRKDKPSESETIWEIQMKSGVIDVVVGFRHEAPVIKKAVLRDEKS